jgi:hypothetical protein
VSSIGEIDTVAEAMATIVDRSRDQGTAMGYFAAMYLGVTRVVKRGLVDDVFANPDRLARLTTVFARRYLDAWEGHEAGRTTTESWEVAFRAAGGWRPTVLQHLLLGMNAHINLDLGVASAEVAPGASIGELRQDFDEINDVLAGLVQQIQGRLNRVSPLYRFVDDMSRSVDKAVINFSISRARAEAWQLATFLAAADPVAAAHRIAEQDRLVAGLGAAIVRPGIVASTGLLAVRITEKRNPTTILDILSGGAS